MASFFSLLRYSFGNEDWRTEEEALDIKPEDTILCITASGDRPLNLLTRRCQKIVCIDANPVQNYLLELKAAAMKVLDHEDYLAFLGATASENRRMLLQLLYPQLSPKAALFWKEHEKMVEKGILYQGTVERLTGMVAKLLALLRGGKVEKLFAINDLEEQRRYVRDHWDSYFWRKTLNILLNPIISRFLIKDPGLINVGSDIKAGSYIYERIQESLTRELANKNPLLSLILRGKVGPAAYSPYLTESGISVIKHSLSALEIHTTNVLDYLESTPEHTFDAFSLSDIASYMSYPNFVRLLTLLIKTAKPGARFCLRQFLSSYEIPSHLQPYFKREEALEKRLTKEDNCFVYRFTVGSITEHAQLKPTIYASAASSF